MITYSGITYEPPKPKKVVRLLNRQRKFIINKILLNNIHCMINELNKSHKKLINKIKHEN